MRRKLKIKQAKPHFSIRIAKAIPNWLITNKYKTIMFFIVFYAGHKIYGLYKTYVQPLLSGYRQMQNLVNPGDQSNEDAGRNGAQAPE
jgi:hypothetical protein